MGADYWAKRASGLLVPSPQFGQPLPCPECCTTCNGGCVRGTLPSQLRATLTGLADADCADCESLNGVYILDQTLPCQYELGDYSGLACNVGYFLIYLWGSGGDLEIGAVMRTSVGGNWHGSWLKDVAGVPMDCATIDETIPGGNPIPGGEECDAVGSTLRVEAI